MNRFTSLLIATAITSSLSLTAEEYFVKELTFPQNATAEQKIDMAARLVPSDRQMAWQNLELTAFLHFGMNTFTNREWGDGKENPQLFNPVGLDTDQWVKTLKDAGFNLVILTAKHHDGFCLWPTATTKHSVASSPWLDGKGDVVKMLRQSCDKYGMKMGVYLSPWDRNAECYGDSPRYNDMFVAQLTELLSNYGTIDEVWFDGACGEGSNGKKQEYDWARFKEVIGRLQPNAVTAIMGDDVRWVGNERGQGRETEWSATAITPGILPGAEEANSALSLDQLSKDLGSRDLVARAGKLYWWPSEVDVSIRPGWFWHATEDPKPLSELSDIYLNSVGRNSVLLLNIPPNKNGVIDSRDVMALRSLSKWVDRNFNSPAAQPGQNANCVVLTEDITRGQRVEQFTVLAWNNGASTPVASGTTIGKKRILTFNPVCADSLTLRVDQFRGSNHNAVLESARFIELPSTLQAGNATLARLDAANLTLPGWLPEIKMFEPMIATLASPTAISGFTYTPNAGAGKIFRYRFYTWDNDTNRWIEQPTTGEFSNIENNPIEQVVYLAEPVVTDRVMLLPLSEATGKKTAEISAFGLLTD